MCWHVYGVCLCMQGLTGMCVVCMEGCKDMCVDICV